MRIARLGIDEQQQRDGAADARFILEHVVDRAAAHSPSRATAMVALAAHAASALGSRGALGSRRSRARPTPPAPRASVVVRAARVTADDARDLLFGDAASPGDVVFLDVRTPKEFGEQHAVGAVNIPVADMTPNGPQPLPGFVDAVNARFPGRTQRFVVGCLSGARSEKAVERLVADGWPRENLLDLEGGFRKFNKEYTPDGKPRAKPGVWKDNGPITWTDS
jgi:rhodanese-related sulfurtransferase